MYSKPGRLLVIGAVSLAVMAVAAARKQRVWTISHGKTGYAVELTRVPTWALLAEDILELFPCAHARHNWMWRAGFGRDDDGEPRWTLGTLLMRVCEARHSIVNRVEASAARVPVDRDVAQRIEPEWVAECDKIFADDD